MIARDNVFLMGVSGKAKNMVVKQYAGKTVITTVPDMSNRVLSDKQKIANIKMKAAIEHAKKIVADPREKERACQILGVPPNKVFRAVVKQFMLTDGYLPEMGESEQEKQDKQTLATLKSLIISEIPGAEIILFGARAKGVYDVQSDWDFVVLSDDEYPKALKWELQEKLFEITMQQGSRVNVLLAQKAKWYSSQEYALLRKKVELNFLVV